MSQDHTNPLNADQEHTCQENIRPGGNWFSGGCISVSREFILNGEPKNSRNKERELGKV